MKTVVLLKAVSVVLACQMASCNPYAEMTTFGQVLQRFLELDEFQEFLHDEVDGVQVPIVIDVGEWSDDVKWPRVTALGQPVRFIRTEARDSLGGARYYLLADYIHLDSKARMQLHDYARKLTLSASLEYRNGRWALGGTHIDGPYIEAGS